MRFWPEQLQQCSCQQLRWGDAGLGLGEYQFSFQHVLNVYYIHIEVQMLSRQQHMSVESKKDKLMSCWYLKSEVLKSDKHTRKVSIDEK